MVDEAAVAGDDVIDAALKDIYRLEQVLGIQAGGEGRRSDEIEEHHRQLSPLRGGDDRTAA